MTSAHAASALKHLKMAIAVPLDKSNITVCLGASTDDEPIPTIQRIQMTDGLVAEFGRICESTAGKCEKDLTSGDSVLAPYEAGSRPDECEIEFLRVPEHDFVAKQLHAIGSPSNIPLFEHEKDFTGNLLFYTIVVTPPTGKPVLLFRVYSPSRELSRSALLVALFANGQYDRVREPGLLFDHRVDCLAHDGYLFIFNKSNFQRIFQYFEMVKRSAKEALDVIRHSIPISNFAEFEQACEAHLQKLAKLKNISQRPYLKTLSVKDLKKVIDEFQLPIKTVKHDGVEKLVFDPSDKWAILKLLDEDYLNSTLTGNKYEATGKRSVAVAAIKTMGAKGR